MFCGSVSALINSKRSRGPASERRTATRPLLKDPGICGTAGPWRAPGAPGDPGGSQGPRGNWDGNLLSAIKEEPFNIWKFPEMGVGP